MNFKGLATFKSRNIDRVVMFRFRSFFNLRINSFDFWLSQNRLAKNIFCFLNGLYSQLRFILNLRPDIPSMDFNLTTSCSLNCLECASLMPYYSSDNQWTISFEQFKVDLTKLLEGANKIYKLKFIGGEPMIVKDLDKMLNYACTKKQIISIEITTNSTIVPSENLCSVLKKYKDKVFFSLSDYSDNSSINSQKLQEITYRLDQLGVYYYVSNYEWFKIGELYPRNRKPLELANVFSECWQKDCIALMDGKFHHCTRSIAIQRLSSHSFLSDENIDIRNENRKSLIKKLNIFFTREFFSACDYCEIHSGKRTKRAIQTDQVQKIGL